MLMNPAGISRKYDVQRTDGSSGPGGKHESCAYFVLDLEHDEFAPAALEAYAKACRKTHPELAKDLEAILANAYQPCGCREASRPHSFGQAFQGESQMAHRLMNRKNTK
jgi:hypothetical protein